MQFNKVKQMSLRNLTVTKRALVRELKKRVDKSSQAEIARLVKVKPPLISNVVAGKTNPCGKLLRWLGYQRVIVYKKVA